MVTESTPEVDFDTLDQLRVMDLAREARTVEERVERYFQGPQIREEFLRRLQAINTARDRGLTDDQMRVAIDAYFANQFTFDSPDQSTRGRVLSAYINRGHHFRTKGVPAIVGTGTVGAVFLGAAVYNDWQDGRTESRVESGIVAACDDHVRLVSELDLLVEADVRPGLASDIAFAQNGVQQGIAQSEGFVVVYCDEDVPELVTRENMGELGEEVNRVRVYLDDAIIQSTNGLNVIQASVDLDNVETLLDSVYQTVQDQTTDQRFLLRAENLYAQGVQAIATGLVVEAQERAADLSMLSSDIGVFSTLIGQRDGLYDSIQDVALEDLALEQADSLYTQGNIAIDNEDMETLQDTIETLGHIDRLLKTSYELRIVSRPGELSGTDRIYTDENGRRTSGLYLIVEAYDPQGNVVDVIVTNEEDGKTYLTSIYGQEFPERVFEDVVDDKQADGIVDDNVVGYKDPGYLTPTIHEPGNPRRELEDTGQITQW